LVSGVLRIGLHASDVPGEDNIVTQGAIAAVVTFACDNRSYKCCDYAEAEEMHLVEREDSKQGSATSYKYL
jgi:hypothetical protein